MQRLEAEKPFVSPPMTEQMKEKQEVDLALKRLDVVFKDIDSMEEANEVSPRPKASAGGNSPLLKASGMETRVRGKGRGRGREAPPIPPPGLDQATYMEYQARFLDYMK